MQVIEEPFEDAGEQDARGYYDFYYSGVVYRFVFPERELHARRYDSSPGEAHFLCYTTLPDGKRRFFGAIPYDDPEFAVATAYLRDTVGADTVNILLSEGYVPVDFTRFPDSQQSSAEASESFHCFQCRAAIPESLDKCPACGWTWQSD